MQNDVITIDTKTEAAWLATGIVDRLGLSSLRRYRMLTQNLSARTRWVRPRAHPCRMTTYEAARQPLPRPMSVTPSPPSTLEGRSIGRHSAQRLARTAATRVIDG